MNVKIPVFWNVTACGLVEMYQCFSEVCCIQCSWQIYIRLHGVSNLQSHFHKN
jgi:hypothetical protein